jgi:lipid-A-disaccharide synthase
MHNKNIAIISGELSGDLQGSFLAQNLRDMLPDYDLWGYGGNFMRSAGVGTIVDISELAVMGLVDVAKKYFHFRKLLNSLCAEIVRKKPSVVVLIDYPGFNLALAKKLKHSGIPVCYYISPQFWAWAQWRVEKIRKYVDTTIVILPFEVEFYKKHGIDVHYVGHPFIDTVQPEMSRERFRSKYGVGDNTIAILPGSRKTEIERLLPVMLNCAGLFLKVHPDFTAIIAAADSMGEYIRARVPIDDRIKIVVDATYCTMAYSKSAIVASGSATLEALISKLPTIVLYKVDTLSWAIGKHLIEVPHIALANLVASERLFPEFIQDIDCDSVVCELEKITFDTALRAMLEQKMTAAAKLLGSGNAAQKAAKIVEGIIFAKKT